MCDNVCISLLRFFLTKLCRECRDISPLLFGKATRRCHYQISEQDFGWSGVNTSMCKNSQILALSTTPIKNVFAAVSVLDDLAKSLETPILVNRLDIAPAVEILWTVARLPIKLSLDVLQSTVAVVSNIMALPREMLVGTPIQDIPAIVDMIAANVASAAVDLNISVEYTADNMVVSIRTVPTSEGSAWSSSDVDSSEGMRNASAVDVEVPSLERLMGYRDPSSPLQIVVYSGDLFFSHVGGVQDDVVHNESIVSSIVSIGVGNSSQLHDLSYYERVSVSFERDGSRTDEVTCASWKPDGLGNVWTSTGCVVDELQSTDSTTVCSCDHLSIFAVVANLPKSTSSGPGYRESRTLSIAV